MKHMVHITEHTIHHRTYIAETPTTKTFKPARSRVLLNITNNNTLQTRSMTQPTQQLPTISTPKASRVEKSTIAKHEKRGINL